MKKLSENEVKFWDEKSKEINEKLKKMKPEDFKKDLMNKKFWWEELVGKLKNKKILDIGCGDTHYVTYWQLTRNDAKGIDLSPGTVTNNNFVHKKLKLKKSFFVSSADKLPFKDNSLDVVHMQWIIHHIPQNLLDKSMQEINRVLKKDGLLLVYETNYAYPFRWIVQTPLLRKINFLRRKAIIARWLDPEEKALTTKGYLDLVRRNGFNVRRIKYESQFFWYPIVLFFKDKKRLHKSVEKLDSFLFKWIIPNSLSKDIKIIAIK